MLIHGEGGVDIVVIVLTHIRVDICSLCTLYRGGAAITNMCL
jgi:hypothetical protein